MRERKTPAQSTATLSQVMVPYDANQYGNVHGGVIMRLMDEVAFVAASRHTHRNVVTVCIDSLSFENPVRIGDVVALKATLIYVGKTSMEIEVYVETERLKTGEIFPVATAYLTMVALNEEGRPVEIPQLIPQTEKEKKKYAEAKSRREQKLRKLTTEDTELTENF
ncbi:acyl-CoA thioesterase [Patescibacteria group bacterium]|nr:acyl-CoA thioesterase [Patescibacteria group bacterium]